MKQLIFIGFIVGMVGCKKDYTVESYYSSAEQDSLLTEIITYIYIRPQLATWETRFDPKFRSYYVNQLGKFHFEAYHIDQNSNHYYYIIRPARSAEASLRGVGGTFKVNNGKLYAFKEVFNTPVGNLKDLREKGHELFMAMIKRGHINEYLKNPDFIEWPNEMTYYDTLQHEWVVKPGI